MGYDKIIVVLTRPIEYRKKPLSSFMMKLCQIRYYKYPEFIKAMEQRYQDYNDTVEMIQNMEKNGEIFVVRPSEPITLKTIERNPDNLQKVYDLGVKDCKKVIHQLKEYIHQFISKCYI